MKKKNMMGFVKRSYPILFAVCSVLAIGSLIAYSIVPSLMVEASAAAAFTNTGAATASVPRADTDVLVMDLTIPDAWNGVANTADTLYVTGSGAVAWNGDTLNAFPNLGTTSGVGYYDADSGVDFDATEPVVRDLDADSVYTSAADTLVESDGTSTDGAGSVNAVAGDALIAMGDDIADGANNDGAASGAVCTNSLTSPTVVRIDSDTNCSNGEKKEGYVLRDSAAVAATATLTLDTFANLANNEYFILTDSAAAGDAVCFYIDKDDSLLDDTGTAAACQAANGKAGGVEVNLVGDVTAINVAEAFDTAIDGVVGELNVTSTDNLDGTLTLTQDYKGYSWNIGINADYLAEAAGGASALTAFTGGDNTISSWEVNATWAFQDGDADAFFDEDEDIFIENVQSELTYSAAADTDVYSRGGLTAGNTLVQFGAAGYKYTGSAPIDSTEHIYGGDVASTTLNKVDKQADQLIGLAVQNIGTAVDTTDIATVKVWADAGAVGYQGTDTDTLLGSMTVNSADTKEWRLGGLTTAVSAGGLRIFVSADLAALPTNARTMQFQVPVYSDVGADGVVTQDNDEGVYMSSNNDGPTDVVVTNANTQTIDSVLPTISSVTPDDLSLVVSQTSVVTIEFSEAPAQASFTSADFTVVNGSVSEPVFTDADTATVTYTPTDDLEDTSNVLTVGAVWTDLAGNTSGGGAASANYEIDTKEPTVTVVLDDSALNIGDTAGVTITFHEVVVGFTNLDIALTSGGLSDVASGDGIIYTATFTPTDPIDDDTNVITVNKTGVTDSAGNAGVGSTSSANYDVDTIRPAFSSITQFGASGSILETKLVFNDTILDATVTAANFTIGGTVADTKMALTSTNGEDTNTANDNTITIKVAAGVTGSEAKAVVYTAGTLTDAAGNAMLTETFAAGSVTDKAAPIIVSVTPVSGTEEVEITTSLVYVFSEPMVTTFVHGTEFSVLPVVAGWAAAWSNSNKTVTLSHSGLVTDTTYTVTTTEGNVDASGGSVTALTSAGDWSFRTRRGTPAGGGGSGGSSVAPTVTFAVNSGATETTNNTVSLSLSYTDAAEMLIGNDSNFVGSAWEPIASSKTWTLPAGLGAKTIYVAVRNSSQLASSVVSHSVSVVEKVVEPTIDVVASTVTADKPSVLADGLEKVTASVLVKLSTGAVVAGKTVVLDSSRKVEDKLVAVNAVTDADGIAKFEVTSEYEGVSTLMATVDGYAITKTVAIQFTKPAATEEEKINLVEVNVGDLIKSSAVSSAVYYYGADGKRHSFSNSTIYYSYFTDFSSVKEVPAVQLAGIGLGANAKVRPGTWMIKIQSDPKVYAVTPAGILRWVKTEQIANDLYGSTWNKKIIDIDSSFFEDYTIGDAIETSSHPSASLIQYEGDTTSYYIVNGVKRKIADTAVFNANRFQNRFKQVVSTTLSYANGSDITGKEDVIAEVIY